MATVGGIPFANRSPVQGLYWPEVVDERFRVVSTGHQRTESLHLEKEYIMIDEFVGMTEISIIVTFFLRH